MLEFYTSTCHTARKRHTCLLCGEDIEIGERYLRESGKYEGEFFDSCYHLECDDIITRYCREMDEDEWDPDAIWEWLNDRYCRECDHGENKDDDCPFSVMTCPVIRDKVKKNFHIKPIEEERNERTEP